MKVIKNGALSHLCNDIFTSLKHSHT